MRAHIKYIVYNYMFNRFKIAQANYNEAISKAEDEYYALGDLLNDIRADYLEDAQKRDVLIKEAMTGTKG